MTNVLHLWSRVPGEGGKSYAYFQMYLEAGVGRTVVKVAERCGKSLSLLHRLSSRFNWLERAAAYDAHQGELVSRQLAARRAQAQMRQADRAAVLSDTAMVAARRLVGRLQADENAELSPTEITTMFTGASKVEANALEFGGTKMAVNVNVAPPGSLDPELDDELACRIALTFLQRYRVRHGDTLPPMHEGQTLTPAERAAEFERAIRAAGDGQ